MSDWPRLPLGEIFEIARGGSPRPIDAFITDAADGINWISIADASDSAKYIERTKRRIRPEGASRSRAVVPGDLLLTNSMSFGRPYIMRTTGCIHDGWLVLAKKRDGIDQDFFYRVLGSDSVYAAFAKLAAGATVKNLNIELVKGVAVPVPPLPEQRRIAAILDQADALRAKRREALAQLDSLTQSIFIEMFGDPTLNTKQWQVGTLGGIASFFAGNSLPSGIPYERQYGGHFLMKVSDMNLPGNEQFIRQCQYWTAEDGARSSTCPAGSVVLPKRGGAIGTNKKRITTRSTILDPNLMAIAPLESVVDLSYLYHWFMRFDLASISSGSSVPQLNKQDLVPLKIQVPPLALQQTFATRIQAVESLKATHRASLAESDALFASLQHRAFSGSL